jgi:hypothetical protein
MISYEAGNEGWNTTFPVPSFEAQLPKPTLKYLILALSSECFYEKLPEVAAGEESCRSARPKLGEHIANSHSIIGWHLEDRLHFKY